MDLTFESPRILLPPQVHLGAGQRPQSAEKRRWLARAYLLREGDSKVAKMAEEDFKASRAFHASDEKYLYVEYLDWMTEELFQPDVTDCEIRCHQCTRVIGACSWSTHAK
jgi:hypothetical protein